ncbi:MAG TPA: nitrate- and nitrite sensing domain-containing protein [Acidimicrobiales bacterium]|nr:nitrate- and nitrite sensing domain-containing protein [Acidimicrobiales bacterium]
MHTAPRSPAHGPPAGPNGAPRAPAKLRVPIRAKLAAALAMPLAALIAVTLLEVVDTSAKLAEVREQTGLATATTGPTGLVTALQNERAWPAAEMVGFDDLVDVPVPSYEETRAATDKAIAEFRADLETKPDIIGATYADALAGLDQLDQIRADIDANTAPRDLANLVISNLLFERYSALIEPFFDAAGRISLAIGDDELRQGAGLADATARQIEVMAQMLNTVVSDSSVSDGIATAPEIATVAAMRSQFDQHARVLTTATGAYGPIVEATFPFALTENVAKQVDATVGAGRIEDGRSLAAAFDSPPGEGYSILQEAVSDEIARRAGELNRQAESRQRTFVAFAVAVLAVASALAWVVSRSITGPLRSLTRQAKDMADHRLPDAVRDILDTPFGEDVSMPSAEPVVVRTRDEVADVADALNTVQDTALDLAVEQAVLRRNLADSFVNLGRRNQNLLGRQLDFITELEGNETDPDTLADLFRLDHLATRMRRNAESLLVLAGVEPPRQWAAPVRLVDVVRAALSEVEDYQRVRLGHIDPVAILGSSAADLTHLLAELIENALVFSPPDRPVDVMGRAYGDGYGLGVIDDGYGMPAVEIEAANRRLAGSESFTVAPSKYLGHYVAGNLATRRGIRVRVDHGPGSGVAASIHLPPELLTPASDTPAVGSPSVGAPWVLQAPDRGPQAERPPALRSPGPPPLGAPGALDPHLAEPPPPVPAPALDPHLVGRPDEGSRAGLPPGFHGPER